MPTNQQRSRLYGLRHLHWDRESTDEKEERDEKSTSDCVVDLEGRVSPAEQRSFIHAKQTLDINHYQIVDDVWHFSSVDWGRNCEYLEASIKLRTIR